MLIKIANLSVQLGKILPAIYILIGQETYQLNNIAASIKARWRQERDEDVDIKIVDINAAADWNIMAEEVNSYSLFSNTVLIDARFDKKTFDAAAKIFFERYLQSINPRCLVLIRAPNLPLKQLQSMTNNEFVHIVVINSPDGLAIKRWINENLQKLSLNYDKEIPALIYQYNEGNLLACAQILEKLALISEPDKPLTITEVKEQLINQCDYPLFDLADSCLSGNQVKALQLLRQASCNKTEPTLILWLLTQEVRLLMQLLHLTNHGQSFRDASSQLKIWSNRASIYQSAIKKYSGDFLVLLLKCCNKLDSQIKSNQNKHIWQSFELIALSLCTGKSVGYFA